MLPIQPVPPPESFDAWLRPIGSRVAVAAVVTLVFVVPGCAAVYWVGRDYMRERRLQTGRGATGTVAAIAWTQQKHGRGPDILTVAVPSEGGERVLHVRVRTNSVAFGEKVPVVYAPADLTDGQIADSRRVSTPGLVRIFVLGMASGSRVSAGGRSVAATSCSSRWPEARLSCPSKPCGPAGYGDGRAGRTARTHGAAAVRASPRPLPRRSQPACRLDVFVVARGPSAFASRPASSARTWTSPL